MITNDSEYIQLDDTNNYFYSHDIGLIAYLLCKNFEVFSLDKTVKNKVLFIMKRKKNKSIDKAVKQYWDCKTCVDAQNFFNQLKRLKNQIFSA
ncbi:hypothetical protein A2335_02965 [Candidatus Peregrinibacteria bacterium RIFOXYB2_FULL_32_7]|nr:MAG: hypothetical protein A2335_02965 [Candidatus Peregrinibacteria bacterium RIFOXYB2_FULL_32_7]OGY87420.1 MAG: hypothetical protein A2233_00700 [Candidatus Kerfeldbacteria bacterium RIFOXYA2_FULL_38_24]